MFLILYLYVQHEEFVFSSMWVETQGVLLVLAFGIYPFLFSKHSTLLHDC